MNGYFQKTEIHVLVNWILSAYCWYVSIFCWSFPPCIFWRWTWWQNNVAKNDLNLISFPFFVSLIVIFLEQIWLEGISSFRMSVTKQTIFRWGGGGGWRFLECMISLVCNFTALSLQLGCNGHEWSYQSWDADKWDSRNPNYSGKSTRSYIWDHSSVGASDMLMPTLKDDWTGCWISI